MFEKDAEEYANEYGQDAFTQAHMSQMIEPVRMERKRGFQKGAEFGYNKANEWHYVKDGDFPTDVTEREYLVALKSEYTNDFFFEIDIWCRSLHCFASNNPTKVYAWKEIVIPKESE